VNRKVRMVPRRSGIFPPQPRVALTICDSLLYFDCHFYWSIKKNSLKSTLSGRHTYGTDPRRSEGQAEVY